MIGLLVLHSCGVCAVIMVAFRRERTKSFSRLARQSAAVLDKKTDTDKTERSCEGPCQIGEREVTGENENGRYR